MSTERATRPGWFTLVKDVILFGFGLWIIMSQAGLYLDPPPDGPSVLLITVGALFCNGPLMLQALALRFGTSASSAPPAPPAQASVPPSSSGQSLGVDQ